jgi:hypothetical protein
VLQVQWWEEQLNEWAFQIKSPKGQRKSSQEANLSTVVAEYYSRYMFGGFIGPFHDHWLRCWKTAVVWRSYLVTSKPIYRSAMVGHHLLKPEQLKSNYKAIPISHGWDKICHSSIGEVGEGWLLNRNSKTRAHNQLRESESPTLIREGKILWPYLTTLVEA